VALLGVGLVLALTLPVLEHRSVPRGAEPARTPAALSALGRAEPIRPLRPADGLDPARVELGRRLFHETRLSGDGAVACATCHDLARGGADGLPVSLGAGSRAGSINAPTILNAALGFRQYWNGRAATLEEQIDGPLLAAHEMDSSWPKALAVLEADPAYRTGFAQLYGSVTEDGVRNALAAFQRSLPAPAPFDRFLAGDETAIPADAWAGYLLFKSLGCVACHQGTGVGGNMFQRMGLLADYFADRGGVTSVDLGRYNVTGREEDRFVFKVPSLRNVALTAPYFHDGSAATLEEAVRIMARYQLGRSVTAEETRLIAAFLHTLTSTTPSGGTGS
jgi:cytochrome c peroxidase